MRHMLFAAGFALFVGAADAAASAVEPDQGRRGSSVDDMALRQAFERPAFPTLSEVWDAVYGVPVPRPRRSAERRRVPIGEVCRTLASSAQQHALPVGFFIRLIWQESRFDPHAVSPVGAQGVAQFMPEVAAAMGLADPFDPLQALPMSAKLLRDLLAMFDNNLGLAAAAYNAGPKRIFDWLRNRGKLPAETRDYVRHVTGLAAERWRRTERGRLQFELPKRAPCGEIAAAHPAAYVGPVPAPVTLAASRTAARRAAAKPKGHAAKARPAAQNATRARGTVRPLRLASNARR